jgi:hypothetical protein
MKAPWTRIILTLLVLAACVNAFHMTRRVAAPPLVASAAVPDLVQRQERRLANLRRDLETQAWRGTIGYVSDATDAVDADRYSAQFVLVPLVLDPNYHAHDRAVANFQRGVTAGRVPAGYAVEKDYGDGVLLLRRAAR